MSLRSTSTISSDTAEDQLNVYQGADDLLSQSPQLPAAKKIKFSALNN